MALAAGACGSSEGDAPSRAELNAYIEVQAKQAVRERLKDPESAVFSEFRLSSKGSGSMACGKVNSKNGFGGMGGPQRFVASGHGLAFMEEDTPPDEMADIWQRYC